jgi:predicted component of type VI protein secretion system
VPLVGLDIVLGRDPSLAAVVLDDASVDGMHARLIRQAGGNYLLRDQGSIAGTWVNYHLVPEAGTILEHGDLLQLGRVEFRFEVAGEIPQRELRVYPASDPLRPSGLSDQGQA